MSDTTAAIEDNTTLPHRISVQELMHRYDCLVTEVNADRHVASVAPTKTATNTVDTKRRIEVLTALRLVCSLLLCLSSSSKQSEILESTTRRAAILQNLLLSDNINEASQHGESDKKDRNAPSVSVQIVQTTAAHDDVVLEWTYNDISISIDDSGDKYDDHNNHAEKDNHVIPISMMTHDELVEEETLLLQMADTPIPCHGSTDTYAVTAVIPEVGATHRVRHRTALQNVLCQEWGESNYAQILSQHGESRV